MPSDHAVQTEKGAPRADKGASGVTGGLDPDREIAERDDLLGTCIEVLQGHVAIGEFGTQDHGETGARLPCIPEKLADVFRGPRARARVQSRAAERRHEAWELGVGGVAAGV